ncbi:MAG: hypothetical protein PGN33_01630 [Methylobacterium radiotolerans]
MTAAAEAAEFVHTVRQKIDRVGNPLPIWAWDLRRGGILIAFGERPSERQAMSAARAAELNHGLALAAARS